MEALEKFSNETPLNWVEYHDKKIGIVTAGVAYQYAREVFGENASYLKLGFTNPLPMDKIRAFAGEVETLYVIEELDPYMEEQIKAAGISCVGKEKIPLLYELNPDIVRKELLGEENETIQIDPAEIAKRPPTLCAGCPHRHPRNLCPLHCWRSAAPGSRCLAGRLCAVHRTRRPAVRCAVRRPALLPVYTMKYRNQL